MSVQLELLIDTYIDKRDIEDIIFSLGYSKSDNSYLWHNDIYVSIRGCWFSFSYDVEISYEKEDRIVKTVCSTTTHAGRSYDDFQIQLDTIKKLEKAFGGIVYNDGEEGYFENDIPKLTRTEIACGYAYITFERNLASVEGLIEEVDLEKIKFYEDSGIPLIFEKNYIRNNILLPFFVSIMENLLKTITYRYIETNEEAQNLIYKKKDSKLPYNIVRELLNGEKTIIDIEIEEYSFQNFNSANKAFERYLDINLFEDILSNQVSIEGKQTKLVSVLSEMINYRHKLIHEAYLNNTLSKDKMNVYYSSLKQLGNFLVQCLKEKKNIRIELEKYL